MNSGRGVGPRNNPRVQGVRRVGRGLGGGKGIWPDSVSGRISVRRSMAARHPWAAANPEWGRRQLRTRSGFELDPADKDLARYLVYWGLRVDDLVEAFRMSRGGWSEWSYYFGLSVELCTYGLAKTLGDWISAFREVDAWWLLAWDGGAGRSEGGLDQQGEELLRLVKTEGSSPTDVGDPVFPGDSEADGMDFGFSGLDRKLARTGFVDRQSSFLIGAGVPLKWRVLLHEHVTGCGVAAGTWVARVLSESFGRCVRRGRWLSETAVIEVLNDLTISIKSRLPSTLAGLGGYLVDLSVLGGFDTVKNRVDATSGWLEQQREKLAEISLRDHGSEEWLEIRGLIREVVRDWGVDREKVERACGFNRFIGDRGGWAVRGATTLQSVEAWARREDGQKVKVRLRDKEACAAVYSDLELEAMCLGDGGADEESFPFRKSDEAAKTRVVVNHDFRSYLRCSYVYASLSASPSWTTLDKGDDAVAACYGGLADEMRAGGTGLSIDFKAFDTSATADLMEWYLLEWFDLFREVMSHRQDLVSEARVLLDAELVSLRTMRYFVKGEETNAVLGSGFLSSGHRLTSVFGTVVNRAVCLGAFRRLTTIGRVGDSRHQGDDVAAVLDHWDEERGWRFVHEFGTIISRWGFFVNPKKCSVSRSGAEFLRQWVDPKGRVSGYPGRMLRTVLWAKPLSDATVVDWLARLSEMGSSLQVALRRGMRGLSRMAFSLTRRMVPRHLSADDRQKVLEWLATPGRLGGGGWEAFLARSPRGVVARTGQADERRTSVGRQVRAVPRLRRTANSAIVSVGCGGGLRWGGLIRHPGPAFAWERDQFDAILQRMITVVDSGYPMPGVRKELVWDAIGRRGPTVAATRGVVDGQDLGKAPEVFCGPRDGAGWWRRRVLAEAVLRGRHRVASPDAWLLRALSGEYEMWCRRWGLGKVDRGRMMWLIDFRAPPGIGPRASEDLVWSGRMKVKEAWGPLHERAARWPALRDTLIRAYAFEFLDE